MRVGDLVSCEVTSVVSFGLRVRLTGIIGEVAGQYDLRIYDEPVSVTGHSLVHVTKLPGTRPERDELLAELGQLPTTELPVVQAEVVSFDGQERPVLSVESYRRRFAFREISKVGEVVFGRIAKVAQFGLFVRLNEFYDGLVHVSKLGEFRLADFNVGDAVNVRVLRVECEEKKVRVGLERVQRSDA